MKFIQEYQQKLYEIYLRENLICLSDWELVKFDGKNALQFVSENCSSVRSRVNSEGIFDLITDDLISSISQDIKFSLGNIYLYKELGINDFLNEQLTTPQGKTVFTYRQSLGDRRFFFYVSVGFEKLYNFWDRIGDLLCLSLDLDIETRSIYFPTVIKKIEESNFSSENFEFLKNFSEGEYKEVLNRLRKLIVHYRQKDTYFRFEWMKHINDKEAIEKLQQEKDELPELLKKQMKLTIKGFESTILLIKEYVLHLQKLG